MAASSTSVSEWPRSCGACAQQFAPKCRMIVDLAPEHETVAALGRDHGLVAVGRQIDDREPSMSQRHPACRIRPDARAVRAAMAQRVRHAPDHLDERGRGEGGVGSSSPTMPHIGRHLLPW